jgi:hypothetical protein
MRCQISESLIFAFPISPFGPFQVVKKICPTTYLVEDLPAKRQKKRFRQFNVHVVQIRMFHPRECVEWDDWPDEPDENAVQQPAEDVIAAPPVRPVLQSTDPLEAVETPPSPTSHFPVCTRGPCVAREGSRGRKRPKELSVVSVVVVCLLTCMCNVISYHVCETEPKEGLRRLPGHFRVSV